jgi:hypothetical protein
VSLAWGAASDNVGVTAYNVYRGSVSGFVPAVANRVGQVAGLSFTDSGVAPGTYFYAVRAQDAAGNEGASSNQASATVGDTTPPTVSITAPGAGTVVSGASVAVSASASDNVGVAGVQFELDGAPLGVEVTAAPYSVAWDSTKVTDGTHTLTAVARDASGNVATSATVTVSVQNSVPPVSTVVLGDQAVERALDYNAAGLAEAFVTAASVSGSLTRLWVYVDAGSTATALVVGLYGANGAYSACVVLGSPFCGAVAVAWNAVAVPAGSVGVGTNYWLALLGTGGTLRFRDKGAGGSGTEMDAAANLTSLPAAWASGSAYRGGPVSAYGSTG